MGLQMSKKKNIFLFLMISLNYKCSKDAKTGLGLVRECLVQILLHYLESQVDGQSSCMIKEIFRQENQEKLVDTHP